jgi:flagellar protein FliS
MKLGYGVYKTAQVDTNDQGKLILLTYDIAIKHAKLAVEKFDDKKLIEERTKHIYKIQDALEELQQSLNMDAGGEIAVNLYNIYTYMFEATVQANIHSDKSKVVEVLGYLETLRAAWGEATVLAKAAIPDMNLQSMAVRG